MKVHLHSVKDSHFWLTYYEEMKQHFKPICSYNVMLLMLVESSKIARRSQATVKVAHSLGLQNTEISFQKGRVSQKKIGISI